MMMAGTLLAGCAGSGDNPFFQPYDTPYGAPPFEQIKTEHYLPAFREGIAQHEAEVQAIAACPDAPTFDNTIAALDYSGELLTRVGNVFFNLYESDANDALQQIATEVSPMLSEHEDNIYMNDALFRRVAALYEGRGTLDLTGEQARLLSRYTKQVVICYDADGAGRKAAQRAIPILERLELSVRVVTVPGSKDPDEFIKSSGAEAFSAPGEKAPMWRSFRRTCRTSSAVMTCPAAVTASSPMTRRNCV